MDTTAIHFLGFEARALSGRLGQVQPFALTEVMVPAAGISGRALWAIERHMEANRKALHERIRSFVSWLESPFGQRASASDGQRRFVLLRLHFNRVLTQFDLFADALSQRSERENGVWLAGLDAIALDALAMPGFYDDPPVICYLDRGAGAAIRRARTRLPGGGSNPVYTFSWNNAVSQDGPNDNPNEAVRTILSTQTVTVKVTVTSSQDPNPITRSIVLDGAKAM